MNLTTLASAFFALALTGAVGHLAGGVAAFFIGVLSTTLVLFIYCYSTRGDMPTPYDDSVG